MFATLFHRIKIWQHLQCFWLSLQPSSVWRNLQMALETNGNANRIPQAGPTLHWRSLLHPSISPLWCYSRPGASCNVHRLCSMKDSWLSCKQHPSLPFQTIYVQLIGSWCSPTRWTLRSYQSPTPSRDYVILTKAAVIAESSVSAVKFLSCEIKLQTYE